MFLGIGCCTGHLVHVRSPSSLRKETRDSDEASGLTMTVFSAVFVPHSLEEQPLILPDWLGEGDGNFQIAVFSDSSLKMDSSIPVGKVELYRHGAEGEGYRITRVPLVNFPDRSLS